MPVQIKVSFRGYDVVQSGLRNVKMAVDSLPAAVYREEMEQARRDVVEPYPPELSGQRYVRTGERGRRTRIEAYHGSNQYAKAYMFVSDPMYRGRSADPYVIGDAEGRGQAAIHWGRWKQAYVAVTDALARIYERAREVIEQAWGAGSGTGL